MPALDRPIHEGRIGYHIRPGGHGLEEGDWLRFMDFADKQYERADARMRLGC